MRQLKNTVEPNASDAFSGAQDFPHHTEEHSGESWAISYADLLMVVLSFFVLFFSFENQSAQKNQILDQISSTFKNHGNALPGGGIVGRSPSSLSAKPEQAALSDTLSGIYTALGENRVTTKIENSRLVVDLLPNMYAPGAFEVNPSVQSEVDGVLKVLKPYFNDISLTIIGHSDTAKIVTKSRYIQDNFSLSSLRAAHALKLAVRAGFPADELFATGTAQNLRASRTLSIKIQLKGATK